MVVLYELSLTIKYYHEFQFGSKTLNTYSIYNSGFVFIDRLIFLGKTKKFRFFSKYSGVAENFGVEYFQNR